ncbi:DUF5013 domain-containing protein [Sphingobacterium sp. E70]|uniref:DUF5013 domain-containing protein n=1 Tax=Sphingobacterium sp. E70 TaxID=2853439 RepID=UPI00359CAC45
MKNYKTPFTATAFDGNRWGNLDHWITNTSMKNHNGYGGFGSDDGVWLTLKPDGALQRS